MPMPLRNRQASNFPQAKAYTVRLPPLVRDTNLNPLLCEDSTAQTMNPHDRDPTLQLRSGLIPDQIQNLHRERTLSNLS